MWLSLWIIGPLAGKIFGVFPNRGGAIMHHMRYRVSGQDFVPRKGGFLHFNETFIF